MPVSTILLLTKDCALSKMHTQRRHCQDHMCSLKQKASLCIDMYAAHVNSIHNQQFGRGTSNNQFAIKEGLTVTPTQPHTVLQQILACQTLDLT